MAKSAYFRSVLTKHSEFVPGVSTDDPLFTRIVDTIIKRCVVPDVTPSTEDMQVYNAAMLLARIERQRRVSISIGKNKITQQSKVTTDERYITFLSSYGYSVKPLDYYILFPNSRLPDSQPVADLFDKIWFEHKFDCDMGYADVSFQDSFHGTRRALQFLKTPLDIIKYYFKLQKIAMPTSVAQIMRASIRDVLPFFSAVKTLFHRLADHLPSLWFLYVELDTIAGYPLNKNKKLDDNPVDWLTLNNYDEHSPEWWKDNILNVFAESYVTRSEPLLTFVDFVERRWMWTTNGASNESGLYLGSQHIKTKFGVAVSRTNQELIDMAVKAVSERTINMSIFEKPDEKGFKRRLISNLDMGSYLIASYVRYIIEYLQGSIPKWMTATTSLSQDIQVFENIRSHKRAIPLDESQFDHHVSRQAWLGLIAALKQIVPSNPGVELFEKLFHNTNFRFEALTYSWFKGMPSGLALTALCNTLFNQVKQRSIVSPIHWALGDDALLYNETITLQDLEKYYATFGAKVNPLKNWTSRQYGEFLHYLYFIRGRTGYPARMYGSLVYGLKFTDTTPVQRLNELAEQWKSFYDRSLLTMDEKLVAADLSRAVSRTWENFTAATAQLWLHIPKCLHGFGLVPYSYFEFKVKKDLIKREEYQGNFVRLPPKFEILQPSFSLHRFRFVNVGYRTGDQYHIGPIETITDWERVLNMEYPLSQVQKDYAFSTIPLPEIPFVSTARLSQIASSFRFNAFPNTHGPITRINSRLISASLALIQLVNQIRRVNSISVLL